MPDRDARLATARELAEGIERYLEGDRDLSLRTSAAQEHARKAARLCDRALGKGGVAVEGGDRRGGGARRAGPRCSR